MFDKIVGRLYFSEPQVKLYGAFPDVSTAKEYALSRECDMAPNSVLFVIVPGENLIFLSSGNRWQKFENTVVYDCTADTDAMLSDYLWPKDVDDLIEGSISTTPAF